MDLVIIVGIVCFFGVAMLSTIAHRNNPPASQVILVRSEQLKELRESEHSEAGLGIFLLVAVIAGAIWLL
jgi:hypothetical protein